MKNDDNTIWHVVCNGDCDKSKLALELIVRLEELSGDPGIMLLQNAETLSDSLIGNHRAKLNEVGAYAYQARLLSGDKWEDGPALWSVEELVSHVQANWADDGKEVG